MLATTGVLYRMWRRARSWLRHIRTDAPLTQIALDLGDPDSSHFSHSIRQTYGLPPRDMRSVMRDSIFLGAQCQGRPAPISGSPHT
jgi:AraC-like DNA-binding protein